MNDDNEWTPNKWIEFHPNILLLVGCWVSRVHFMVAKRQIEMLHHAFTMLFWKAPCLISEDGNMLAYAL